MRGSVLLCAAWASLLSESVAAAPRPAGPRSLTLVTPISVGTDIPVNAVIGVAYARLSVARVPEPATALPLALGCAALVAHAQRARS